MGCIWILWAGLVICAFVLGIDKWAFAFPGCGETKRSPSDDGIQPLAADWKGKLFFKFSWSWSYPCLPLRSLFAVFLLGVFRLGLLSCLGNSPPPFSPFPPFLGKGNFLSDSPAKCLGVEVKPFFLRSQPGVITGNTRCPTWACRCPSCS